jgi:hypothetical protein
MAIIGGLTVTEVTVTKSEIRFLVDLRREVQTLLASHNIDDLVAPTGQ